VANETLTFQLIDVNVCFQFYVRLLCLHAVLSVFLRFQHFHPFLFSPHFLFVSLSLMRSNVTYTRSCFPLSQCLLCLFSNRDAARAIKMAAQCAHRLNGCVTLTSASLFVQCFKVGYAGPGLTIIFAVASCYRNVSVVEPAT
jgi:hypothetical protein